MEIMQLLDEHTQMTTLVTVLRSDTSRIHSYLTEVRDHVFCRFCIIFCLILIVCCPIYIIFCLHYAASLIHSYLAEVSHSLFCLFSLYLCFTSNIFCLQSAASLIDSYLADVSNREGHPKVSVLEFQQLVTAMPPSSRPSHDNLYKVR